MTTPTPLLRAKLAIGALGVATLSATAVGAPAHAATLQVAARPTHHIAVQLLAETNDTGTIFGVADSHLYDLSPAELTARLTELRNLGVTDLRVAVPWVYIEPAAGTYNWTKMDAVVETATAMGFTLTGAVTSTPTWAGLPLAGAPNPDTYANFAGSVAGRYGSQIANYEVWNEPNGVIFYAPVSATGYTEMLKAAYTAIKAANPDAVVLAGSLGATGDIHGISVTPQRFLAEMYAAGAAGYFDALSYHPYHFTLPFSAGGGTYNAPLDQVRKLYELMVANGDGAKKIWATEYGTATTPGWGVTQGEQAALLRDFLTAWSRLSYAGPAFVYTSQDAQSGILNHEFNFGLFMSSGAPKLAAQVLAELIAASGLGALPDYTAPRMSAARDAYLQVASIGFGLVNQALVLPHAAIAVVYNLMPPPVRQAFTVVANAVSLAAAFVVTAVSPVVQAAIAAVLTVGSALSGPGSGAAGETADQEVEDAAESAEVAGDTDADRVVQVSLTDTDDTDSADEVGDPAGELVSVSGDSTVVAEQATVEETETVEETVVADETPTEDVTVDETEVVTVDETKTVTVDEPANENETTVADKSNDDESAETDRTSKSAVKREERARTGESRSEAADKSSRGESAERDTETAGTSKREEKRAEARAEKREEKARSEGVKSEDPSPRRSRPTSASPQDKDRSSAATGRGDGDGSTRGSGRDRSSGASDSGASE